MLTKTTKVLDLSLVIIFLLSLVGCSNNQSEEQDISEQLLDTYGKPIISKLLTNSNDISNNLAKKYQYDGISYYYAYGNNNMTPKYIIIGYKKQDKLLGFEVFAVTLDIKYDFDKGKALYSKMKVTGNYYNFDEIEIPSDKDMEHVIDTINKEASKLCKSECYIFLYQVSSGWKGEIADKNNMPLKDVNIPNGK